MAKYNTVFDHHNTWFGQFCCLCATKIAPDWTPLIRAFIIRHSIFCPADNHGHAFSSGFPI
jgi:hypothetical protein